MRLQELPYGSSCVFISVRRTGTPGACRHVNCEDRNTRERFSQICSVQKLLTSRLQLSPVTETDAAFICELMNSPGWLRWIGDRFVRTPADALAYLQKGPLAMEQLGLGLYIIRLRNGTDALGIVSLVKRNELENIDIGFALLPQYEGHGYAREATARLLNHACAELELDVVQAVALSDNAPSVRLLTALGFTATGTVQLPTDAQPLTVFTYRCGADENQRGT